MVKNEQLKGKSVTYKKLNYANFLMVLMLITINSFCPLHIPQTLIISVLTKGH